MIKYSDLVDFIKEYHVNWNTELFSVLSNFLDWYMENRLGQPTRPSPTPHASTPRPAAPQSAAPASPLYQRVPDFKHPDSGEYTSDDLMSLFST